MLAAHPLSTSSTGVILRFSAIVVLLLRRSVRGPTILAGVGPSEEAADVEAHMPYKMRRDEEPPTEKATGAEPQADDVEGHAARVKYGPTEDPQARR